ncbi:hypothetical protein ES708_11279 [subsurface metagenome]
MKEEFRLKAGDVLASNIDILPNIVHLFGLDPIEKFEGR